MRKETLFYCTTKQAGLGTIARSYFGRSCAYNFTNRLAYVLNIAIFGQRFNLLKSLP